MKEHLLCYILNASTLQGTGKSLFQSVMMRALKGQANIFILPHLLIVCLRHPLSLCLPHDAHFRAGMVLYAPYIATRVPLQWTR